MTRPDVAALAAEEALLAQHAADARDPGAIFILGAPRTGSTLIYQMMAAAFGLPYISNLTNDHYGATPIVGLAIQKSVGETIQLRSNFGKTSGPWQPSEGSAVMGHWFGGGHPSQIVSARIIEGREPHMLSTLRAVEAFYGKPLLVKNAWNCFRLPYLIEAMPIARFIWIRRDLTAAARSDLAARYATKGSADAWNSATPANVDELRKLPPAQQVVENQHAFSRAIGNAFRSLEAGRRVEVWYEDLMEDAQVELRRIGRCVGLEPIAAPRNPFESAAPVGLLSPTEEAAIVAYATSDDSRFGELLRHQRARFERDLGDD